MRAYDSTRRAVRREDARVHSRPRSALFPDREREHSHG